MTATLWVSLLLVLWILAGIGVVALFHWSVSRPIRTKRWKGVRK